MVEISDNTTLLIRSAVDRYERSSKPTRYLYLAITASLAVIILAMIVHAYFVTNSLEKVMAPGGVLSSLFLFVFIQLRGMDRCLWEANTLDVVAEAGGKTQLLAALENISCKNLSIKLGAIGNGDGD